MAGRNDPPRPPRGFATVDSESGQGGARRCRAHTVGFARFFSKQLLLFAACAFLIMVVDFVLYVAITIHESDANFNSGTPAAAVRTVNESLAHDGDTWSLADEGAAELARHGAWAMLVDAEGSVAWSQSLPDDVPVSYSLNDVSMFSHYAAVADYPAFFWDRSDGLLVVGFPKGEFWTNVLTYPTSSIRNFPLYVLSVFAVDVAILFLLYAVSRRRTQNAVGPIANALDRLSEGRGVEVQLKGDLREIGRQLTEASELIQQKDAARANWVRGVSHDIRTPLSLIVGYADGIAQDAEASEDVRTSAQAIMAQGLKIRDLVTDLNTASRLDYDLQPLSLERVHLARLLRGVAAEHANSGLDGRHPLELEVAEGAAEAVVLGDGRLLTRAVENVVANARIHNEGGCTVRVRLTARKGTPGGADADAGGWAVVSIADDGAGIAEPDLARLEARLARARTARTAAGCAVGSAGADAGAEHGLGLVLVDRIVRSHGGVLALSGAPGQGFAVELQLPLA